MNRHRRAGAVRLPGSDRVPATRRGVSVGRALTVSWVVDGAVRDTLGPQNAHLVRRDIAVTFHGTHLPPLAGPVPLLGRMQELRAIEGSMNAVEAGIGGLVAFRGEGGIGKTRLAEEVMARRREPRLVHGMGIGLARRGRAADVAVAGDPRTTGPRRRRAAPRRSGAADDLDPERFTRFRAVTAALAEAANERTGPGRARRRRTRPIPARCFSPASPFVHSERSLRCSSSPAARWSTFRIDVREEPRAISSTRARASTSAPSTSRRSCRSLDWAGEGAEPVTSEASCSS